MFEFCTAFARPKLKCCHPKFKKNEAFARYCEKTRAFARCRVTSSATFRVSPVMSCCGARNFLLAVRFAKFRPLPLLFARFICHRQRSQTSPLQYLCIYCVTNLQQTDYITILLFLQYNLQKKFFHLYKPSLQLTKKAVSILPVYRICRKSLWANRG